MPELNRIIEEAQSLSAGDQARLIGALTTSLTHREMIPASRDFWQPRSLEQHLVAQQVKPVNALSDFKTDFWPENESTEDFLVFIASERRNEIV